MVVETVGEGDDVVLVHGALSWGRDTFSEQLVLADRYRLHVVDRRGYGAAAPAVAGEVGWPVDAPDLIDLLEGLGGAHLVGHSYGGVDALVVAGRRPELVRSLVVVEPPMYDLSPDPEVAALAADVGAVFAEAPGLDPEQFYARWASIVLGHPERMVQYRIHHWTPQDRDAADATRQEAFPTGVPVDWDAVRRVEHRVVATGGWPSEHRRAEQRPAGARGAHAFQDTARAIAQLLGVEPVLFPASGHTLQDTDADAFNALLVRTWSAADGGS